MKFSNCESIILPKVKGKWLNLILMAMKVFTTP